MTHPFTHADEIAAYLSTVMSGITKANGFHTDIGIESVFRGRKKIDDGQVPCAVIIEGEDRPGGAAGRESVKLDQDYVLGGYDECDPDQPNDKAHLILKDIKKAIFKDGPRMGGRVMNVTYRGRDIGPRADGGAIVFAVVYITISFVETLTDP